MNNLADPSYAAPGMALPTAAEWVQNLLTGRLGTAIAVLAIAWLGVAMLRGRLPVRQGLRVILGCFILFGAPIIAQGFLGAMRGPSQAVQVYSAPAPVPIALPAKPPQFDPYAGASLPGGR